MFDDEMKQAIYKCLALDETTIKEIGTADNPSEELISHHIKPLFSLNIEQPQNVKKTLALLTYLSTQEQKTEWAKQTIRSLQETLNALALNAKTLSSQKEDQPQNIKKTIDLLAYLLEHELDIGWLQDAIYSLHTHLKPSTDAGNAHWDKDGVFALILHLCFKKILPPKDSWHIAHIEKAFHNWNEYVRAELVDHDSKHDNTPPDDKELPELKQKAWKKKLEYLAMRTEYILIADYFKQLADHPDDTHNSQITLAFEIPFKSWNEALLYFYSAKAQEKTPVSFPIMAALYHTFAEWDDIVNQFLTLANLFGLSRNGTMAEAIRTILANTFDEETVDLSRLSTQLSYLYSRIEETPITPKKSHTSRIKETPEEKRQRKFQEKLLRQRAYCNALESSFLALSEGAIKEPEKGAYIKTGGPDTVSALMRKSIQTIIQIRLQEASRSIPPKEQREITPLRAEDFSRIQEALDPIRTILCDGPAEASAQDYSPRGKVQMLLEESKKWDKQTLIKNLKQLISPTRDPERKSVKDAILKDTLLMRAIKTAIEDIMAIHTTPKVSMY